MYNADPMSDSAATLFVFHTQSRTHTWEYDALPEGWRWIGEGHVTPLNQPSGTYQREVQFGGPETNTQTARAYLDGVFADLARQGVVSVYKIEDRFLP